MMNSLCKVGNQTSSQDPLAVNSRVFVGNLNTFQVNKVDVEKVFQRYGRIVGISMHKGFAFVQFANPFDARSACLGEDAKTISGQVIDVNMVSEPKPHQGKTKSKTDSSSADQNASANGDVPSSNNQNQKPVNNSISNSDTSASSEPLLSSPNINPRKRDHSAVEESGEEQVQPQPPCNLHELNHYDLPDILICGNCKDMFTNIFDMVDHKKNYCKLRFMCKCGPPGHVPHPPHDSSKKSSSSRLNEEDWNRLNNNFLRCNSSGVKRRSDIRSSSKAANSLICQMCFTSFVDPMKLLVHVQKEHDIRLVEEETDSLAVASLASEI